MRVEIDFEGAQPPAGTLQLLDDGQTVVACSSFVGWLNLLRELENLLERPEA